MFVVLVTNLYFVKALFVISQWPCALVLSADWPLSTLCTHIEQKSSTIKTRIKVQECHITPQQMIGCKQGLM